MPANEQNFLKAFPHKPFEAFAGQNTVCGFGRLEQLRTQHSLIPLFCLVLVMKYPRIGVGVLVIDKGRVLLGKRKGSHGAGTWSAPGGHLEFGESIEDCARREVREETGLEITDIRFGPFTNNIFTAEQKHYVTIFVLASPAAGELKNIEPDKCEGWEWFESTQLPEPLFPPLASLRQQGFFLSALQS